MASVMNAIFSGAAITVGGSIASAIILSNLGTFGGVLFYLTQTPWIVYIFFRLVRGLRHVRTAQFRIRSWSDLAFFASVVGTYFGVGYLLMPRPR
jgi:hypothetical protein